MDGLRRPAISSKIFVGNLNYETTETELNDLFSEAGQIVDIFVPADRVTGRPRGFAIIEFATPDQAAEAIEKFEGASLGGRTLRVNEADARPPRAPSLPPRGGGRPPFASKGGGKNKGSRRGLRSRKRSL